MITAAHVQHVFAGHDLALNRYAKAPKLCTRQMCEAVGFRDAVTYLAAAPNTDFTVVVFKTPAEAKALLGFAVAGDMSADRRANTLLVYLRSARARLAIVRRIFSGL